ncbi:MAG: hypothetical protein ACJ8D8_00230 [Microvirga sp.]
MALSNLPPLTTPDAGLKASVALNHYLAAPERAVACADLPSRQTAEVILAYVKSLAQRWAFLLG